MRPPGWMFLIDGYTGDVKTMDASQVGCPKTYGGRCDPMRPANDLPGFYCGSTAKVRPFHALVWSEALLQTF
jgi:hypothetical protein